MATHVQSGDNAAFASFAELEQFIAGWLEPSNAEPDESDLKAEKRIDR